MQGNVLETIMGAVVLIAAAVFLYVIYSGSGIKEDRGGYQLTVRFDRGGRPALPYFPVAERRPRCYPGTQKRCCSL